MPFTFKLSQRLARLWRPVPLLSTLALAACERPVGGVAGPSQPGAQVVEVVVSPDTITLQPAQRQQFSARGRSLAGDSVPVTPVWTATGGAISTDGVYTADTVEGAFQVTAMVPGPISGSSSVRVRKQVASVTVSPVSGTVTPGQTVQLTATPKDASGTPLTGRTITWASDLPGVATVSTSGLVTGVAAGSATITATSEGKSGTAAITVTAPGGGGTILLQEAFADNAFAARGWYDNTAMTITDTVHIAGSTHALEVHFRVGATTPTWGGAARHLFQPSETVYLSYWVKYSANWVGSGQPYHPHEFMFLSTLDGAFDGPSNSYLATYVEHNYQSGGIPVMHLQDSKNINLSFGTPPVNLIGVTENRSTCGCNGVAEPQLFWSCFNAPPWYNAKSLQASRPWFQPTPGPGYKNDWNHVEAYFQLNTIVGGIGQSNGIMRYWFNGVLVMEATNVQFRTGAHPTIAFNQFLIAPYIGNGSPVDQYMWVDDLTVATAKP